MEVIAPTELKTLYNGKAAALMENICADSGNSINAIHYLDLRQSMRNGGGPACLRLRVPLTFAMLNALKNNTGLLANETMLSELETLVETYYQDKLVPEGLRASGLYHDSAEFLEKLSALFKIRLILSA
jgi:succinylarginine dihydrolase